MLVKTRVFELRNGNYKNLSELAKAMGISVSQIYRVREGTRSVNKKFVVGAIKAFPGYKLDDLFYLTPESPTINTLAAKKNQIQELTSRQQQTLAQTHRVNVHRPTLRDRYLREKTRELKAAQYELPAKSAP